MFLGSPHQKMVLANNPVFWSIVIAAVAAQGLKILLILFRHAQDFHLADLVVTGGMPSSHTALVSALALSAYLTEGFTTLFFVTLVLALIVIRDSLGVRRTVGEEGQVISQLITKAKLRIPFHYSLGHTPLQVVVGAAIGIVSAIVAFGIFS
ncbi:MAG TPA: divergent PAP2 family protein [Candidatus Binatia bacterium]|nr:divergent PAP2 family protein [Candidatus Binatia bacterium]